MACERADERMEVPALVVAFVLAPIGSFVIWIAGTLAAVGVALACGYDVESPDDPGHWAGPFAAITCGGYWLLLLPVGLLLRSVGRLSFRAIVLPAVVLPTALAAFLALVTWSRNGDPLVALVATTLLLTPGTVATATNFWGLYCFFTGHRFFEAAPGSRAMMSVGRSQ